MDFAAWVSVVAAAISLGALGPAIEQARSMRKQTALQQAALQDAKRPNVWVDFRPNSANGSSVYLFMTNDGASIARHIQVHCEPSIRRSSAASRNDGNDEISLFRDGLVSLPPGREMRWYLGEGGDLLREGRIGVHKVTVTCEGPFGPEEPLVYELNFLEFRDISGNRTGSLARVERSIEKATKEIAKIATQDTSKD